MMVTLRRKNGFPTAWAGHSREKRSFPITIKRPHNDPKLGVVDENCKIHGTDNLFIAGSSVFPSSGFANPTLTLVSLALRLADHIKGAYS